MILKRDIALVIGLFLCHTAQGLERPKAPEDICKNEDYKTPTSDGPAMGPLPVTCCANEKLTPGISFEKYWNDCAFPDNSEGKAINVTMWRIYSCIVKKSLDGKVLTLENFAAEMTKEYPEEKRKLVMENIKKQSVVTDDDKKTELEKLMVIRSKYYDAELDSCSKNGSEIRRLIEQIPAYYTKIYKRGGYCLNSDIPIHPDFYPLVEDTDLLKSLNAFLDSIIEGKENKTDGLDIKQGCRITSSWIVQNITTLNEMFKKPNVNEMLRRVKPKWANEEVMKVIKTNLDKYYSSSGGGDEDSTQDEAESFLENFKIQFIKELMAVRDEAKSVIVSCLMPTIMKVSITESLHYELCK